MAGERGLVFVKLGGSLLTDKRRPEALRADVLDRLAGELAALAARHRGGLVLGHGSGSFGHVAAARFGTHRGIESPEQLAGVSLTQDRAAALHRHLVAALIDRGALPFSLPPSAFAVASGGAAAEMWLEPLERALASGLLPVTYGDVVLDRKREATILSTEAVFEFLIARLVDAGRVVERAYWLGETDGVYGERGETVAELAADELGAFLRHVRGASGTDVTGGMRLRLETTGRLAARGVPSTILDGRVPGRLAAALAGEPVPGTRISGGLSP